MAHKAVVDSSTQVIEVEFMTQDGASIKKEVEEAVKPEPAECVVCATRSENTFDMFNTKTRAKHSLHQVLQKLTRVDLSLANNCSRVVCKTCLDLVDVLEQAEIEYTKLKESFEAIIKKNPLFESQQLNQIMRIENSIKFDAVKDELLNMYEDDMDRDDNSDDEPLALTQKKRHRKQDKNKKKPSIVKRKTRSKINDDSWECTVCGEHGTEGGVVAETAHKLAAHTFAEENSLILRDVIKKEDSADGTESPHYQFKAEIILEEEDSSSTYTPVRRTRSESSGKRSKSMHKAKIRKKGDAKVVHQCDQCDSKFKSLQRLKQHLTKHEESKPPYICEVCGAHYKHKRACDIHVALHKGISDWKCEECNKLFPSKGALQRHNNIHTGKLNYQCDLCGKSFIHTSSFKMHKLSHSGVKPHSCDVCGLALMTRSHLKRHKRVHSGEKRHECPVCGKRFSERYNLAAHSKSHEGGAPPTTAALPRRRLFRCPFCAERFERRYMLERHMQGAHGRTLERPPPTPRNTMSKLLKAQAQARTHPAHSAHDAHDESQEKTKPAGSPEARTPPVDAPKLFAHLSGASAAASTWSGAYAAEFGLRHDFH